MNNQQAAIIYGGVQHLASIAAVATLMGTGHLSEAVGAPILAGLVGIGVGAGAALIIPGVSAMPTGALAQPQSAGGAAPASSTTAVAGLAPVQRVEAVEAAQAGQPPATGATAGNAAPPAAS